jgi:Cu-processing system permease protein
MFQHFIATWRAGWRSHSFRAVLVIAAFLLLATWLASAFSGRHPQTVSLDIGLSGIRVISVLLILFWTQELLGREIDRKTVLLALAYPLPRSSYLLGRYLGIIAMLGAAIAFLGVCVYLAVVLYTGEYVQQHSIRLGGHYVLTLLYIFVDGMTIAAFVLLVSSFATTALLPMACGAMFAIAARSYNRVLAFLLDQNSEAADISHIFAPIVGWISWLIPDLDKLDIRDTVLYRLDIPYDALVWGPLAALCYTSIMLALSCLVFKRREFS